ncbi:MAG: hypothetical protein HZA05_06360 [Nitrospirae bacterium]|nr:hypothetical protein [Nitrospirota bacterium]
MSKSIYLDVCALSRPFDEQHYLRIRIETEAFNLILSRIKKGDYKLLMSPVHIKEIEAISDAFERIELRTILEKLGEPIKVNLDKTRKRAEELVKSGFGVADAAHVAFAEEAKAQFISCDDALIKKCLNHDINVWCGNPVAFCEKEGLR